MGEVDHRDLRSDSRNDALQYTREGIGETIICHQNNKGEISHESHCNCKKENEQQSCKVFKQDKATPRCYNLPMIGNISLIVLLGWGIGALINYIADVLPVKRRLTVQFCPVCESRLPLFNYLVWPRKCTQCGTRRSWRSWIVEVTSIALVIWQWIEPSPVLGFPLGVLVLTYFGIVVVIDLEHRIIMHAVSLIGAFLGFGIGLRLHGLVPTLVGGVVGFSIMLLLYYFGIVFARIISRRRGSSSIDEALGFGDVNLSGVIGLLLGWPAILLGLTISILFGGLTAILFLFILTITGRYRLFSAIPYGPSLVTGGIILLYFRDYLLAYLGN